MPKPPPIDRKRVAAHENTTICENINDLNWLDSPKTTRRADDEETYKKADAAHQRNQQIAYLS